MKEFYIIENETKKGPFSLKDLKNETVLPDTLMCKEGWPAWIKAKDAVSKVPEIDLIINDTPPIPKPNEEPKKKKPNILSTLYKASEGDFEDLGSYIEGDENNNKKEEIPEDNTTWTQRIYSFVGDHIDMLLKNNQEDIDSNTFYSKLDKARKFYLSLTPVRQNSFNFLISCVVVYFILVMFFLSSGEPGNIILGSMVFVVIWAAFAALNQFKFIEAPISKVVNVVVLFTMGFLPKAVKSWISAFVKFIIFAIIVWFIGFPIGLIYIVYRVVITFVNPDKLPSFEQS